MSHFVEIRSYNLKPETRDRLHQIMAEQALPMLARWGVDVVTYGPSPHGRTWGNVAWDEAARLPGSEQLGLSKQFLVRYPWHRMTPHPEWVDPHWNETKFQLPFAAGIPGELRIVFIPAMWNMPKVVALEPGIRYQASFFNPATGTTHAIGAVDGATEWQIPNPPALQDFVVVLEKRA